MKRLIKIVGIALLTLLAACSQKPHEIHYGSEECAYCKMMIADNRFAAQIVTDTGKAIKFDSIECLAKYTGEHKSELEAARYWVSDFNNPGSWLNIENAVLIQSETIKSPMGRSLLALATRSAVEKHIADYPGKRVTWQQLVK